MNMWDRVLNLDSQRGTVRIETFGGKFASVIHLYALIGVFGEMCPELYDLRK